MNTVTGNLRYTVEPSCISSNTNKLVNHRNVRDIRITVQVKNNLQHAISYRLTVKNILCLELLHSRKNDNNSNNIILFTKHNNKARITKKKLRRTIKWLSSAGGCKGTAEGLRVKQPPAGLKWWISHRLKTTYSILKFFTN